MLRSLRLIVPLLCFSTAALAQGPFSSPESAVQDPVFHAIYVSNISGKPGVKDGDGFISLLGADGRVSTLHFLPTRAGPKLNSPCGLALIDKTLWVADVDRVIGFDLASRKAIRVIPLQPFGVGLANDLAVGPDGKLYVSDTLGDQVLAIDLHRKGRDAVTVILKGATGGANGLAFDQRGDLLIASSPIDFQTPAQSWRVHTEAGKPFHHLSPLASAPGIYDGIAVLPGGQVLLSDWKRSAILRLGADGTLTPVFEKVAGPADFSLAADGQHLIVPDMAAGTVTLRPLP